MAVGQGVFSDDEIDGLLDRMEERAKRAGRDNPGASAREALSQAATEMTKEQLTEQLISKRLEVASKVAAQARARALDAMPEKMREAERLNAFNVGSEKQGVGTSASVDAAARALQMSLWSQVEHGLLQHPGLIDRLSNFFGVGDTSFTRLIAREMARLNGDGSVEPTGDEDALAAARVFSAALEKKRQMLNEQGAWVGKLDGYIARTTHDPLKVSGGYWREVTEAADRIADKSKLDWGAIRQKAEAKAFGVWRDFIGPLLHDKTFDGLELHDVGFTKWEDEAQEARQMGRRAALKEAAGLHATGLLKRPDDLKELFLYRVFSDIVTGRHIELSGANDESDFRPPASTARAVSKSRVLHFKGPDAWMDYNEKYGRGGLMNTVLTDLERGARNTALMRSWGPSPQAAFEAERGELAKSARQRGDTPAARDVYGHMVQANFDQISGLADAPDNLRLAATMQSLRGWEALTKLGGIPLSKPSDFAFTSATFARAGAGYLRGLEAATKGLLRLRDAEGRRAADALGVGARSFAGHLGGQYAASDGAKGWIAWATRLMYKINGFDWLNNGIRQGAAEMYSRFLGQEAEHDWAGLQAGTRESFERFGIGADDWEGARNGLTKLPDGRTYFTLDHFDRLAAANPADAARLGETKLRFGMLIHNLLDDTVSEPRARERAFMSQGTRPGTRLGELARTFFQFKGFVNTIVGRHLVPAARGYAGMSPVMTLPTLLAMSMATGWLSMNMHLISRGEQPKLVGDGGAGDVRNIVFASLAQGGGLGIYGDFLFGELNRNDQGFDWGSLGGPLISDSEQFVKIMKQAYSGGAVNSRTGRSLIPGEMIKLGAGNIPLVNLWYTRLALDYGLIWRMQEAASPGYLQRYEERVRSQDHSDFIVPPTSAAPQ